MLGDEYYIFVLGYDLLRDRLRGMESDKAYFWCRQIYEQFEDCGHNEDKSRSTYDNLQEFVNSVVFDFDKAVVDGAKNKHGVDAVNARNERNMAYLVGYEDGRLGNKSDYKKLDGEDE